MKNKAIVVAALTVLISFGLTAPAHASDIFQIHGCHPKYNWGGMKDERNPHLTAKMWVHSEHGTAYVVGDRHWTYPHATGSYREQYMPIKWTFWKTTFDGKYTRYKRETYYGWHLSAYPWKLHGVRVFWKGNVTGGPDVTTSCVMRSA